MRSIGPPTARLTTRPAEVMRELDDELPKSSAHMLATIATHRARHRVFGMQYDVRPDAVTDALSELRLDFYFACAPTVALGDVLLGGCLLSRALPLALRSGQPKWIVKALGFESLGRAMSRGSDKMAGRLMTEARGIAEKSADPTLLGTIAVFEGALMYSQWRFKAASERLAQARAHLVELPRTWSELNMTRTIEIYAAHNVCAISALRRLYAAEGSSAARRGDRYTELLTHDYETIVWLADDKPEHALERLKRPYPSDEWKRLHVLMYARSSNLVAVQLYRDAPDHLLAELESAARARERALYQRVDQSGRGFTRWVLGRIALARLERKRVSRRKKLREIARYARGLELDGLETKRGLAGALRAGAAYQTGDDESAVRHLRQAITMVETGGMQLDAAAMRRILGGLLGGDEGKVLVEQADAWMKAEGVVNPGRMAAARLPGFGHR